jgi:hypothetical protein
MVAGILLLQCEAAPAPAKAPAAGKPSVTAAAAAAPQQQQRGVDPPSSNKAESSQPQVLEEALSIDSIAAEAAARPAVQLPSQYAVKGVIDPQSPLFSGERGCCRLCVDTQGGCIVLTPQPSTNTDPTTDSTPVACPAEEPGVLVPLAQGRSPVGDWLAAVEAAGPSTPLSDPMFVGTVFIPHNEVRAEWQLAHTHVIDASGR